MKTEIEFLKIISARYTKAFERIIHVINQLDTPQIWDRPTNNSNSIGIIWQHLEGNLNQWICSGVGGETYERKRSQEFKEINQTTKKDILLSIESLRRKIDNIISNVQSESLLFNRNIQGFDETVMSALILALTHLELHGGQIIYIGKMILGDKYIETWKPANKEQGK